MLVNQLLTAMVTSSEASVWQKHNLAEDSTYSCLVSSSRCCLAKLTGCAPGKLVWCLSSKSATSLRMVYRSWPDALTPGRLWTVPAHPVAGSLLRLRNGCAMRSNRSASLEWPRSCRGAIGAGEGPFVATVGYHAR